MHASTLTVVFYETAKDLIFHAEKKKSTGLMSTAYNYRGTKWNKKGWVILIWVIL